MEYDLQLDEITKAKVNEHLILFAVKFREYLKECHPRCACRNYIC